ncbi:MAG TPA: hypothetical protein VGM43_03500 [Bryobacteraceae bacterium]
MALPVLTVVTVMLLRNAWAGNSERRQLAPVIDVSLAFGLVILLQMALAAYAPALALPRWRATQGGWAGWLFLTELRTMFPPNSRISRQSPGAGAQLMYIDEVRWRAEELQRQLRRRNTWTWCVAAAILILFSVRFASTNAIAPRLGSALIIGGTLFIILQVWRMGAPRSLGADSNFEVFREFCRGELDRQRKLLRLILYSYILLLIPGLLLVLAGAVVYAWVFLMYVFLGAELLYRETIHLQQEHSEITFTSPAATSARSRSTCSESNW